MHPRLERNEAMANDPYKVLGIDRTATDEEVKKAYRELARKYHPDNYVNTPLADLAEEKMKEINEAYEAIKAQRKADEEARRTYGDPSYGGGSAYGEERFREIRSYIAENNFYEAEVRLNSIPNDQRSAEWYYLKGVHFRARSWYFEAAKYFETATRMDPQNEEYRMAAESIREYTSGHGRRERKEDMVCDLCCDLMVLDCCCECCGGDLISCC